jgi:nitroreductase
MNEVIRSLRERRSIRKFKPDMVPREKIEAIMETGLYAASGRGQQKPIVIAVTDKALRDKLSKVNYIQSPLPDKWQGALDYGDMGEFI